jgi:hypothetical protein
MQLVGGCELQIKIPHKIETTKVIMLTEWFIIVLHRLQSCFLI